jgi:hypothetical protein
MNVMNTVNFEEKYKYDDKFDEELAAKYRAEFAEVRPSEELLTATAQKMQVGALSSRKLPARRCAAVAAAVCFVLLAALPSFGKFEWFGTDEPANDGAFSTASIYTAGVNADGTSVRSGEAVAGGAALGDVVMTPEALSEDIMKYEGLVHSAANKETFANPSHTENVQLAENTEDTENVEAYTGGSTLMMAPKDDASDLSNKQTDEGVAVSEDSAGYSIPTMISTFGETKMNSDISVESGGVVFSDALTGAMAHYGGDIKYRVIVELFSDGVELDCASGEGKAEMERFAGEGYIVAFENYNDGYVDHNYFTLHATLEQLKDFPASEQYGYCVMLYGERLETTGELQNAISGTAFTASVTIEENF